jgi:hypothetical protein
MTGRRRAGAVVVVVGLGLGAAACGDDGPGAALLDPVRLCTTVQAWSDATVDVVDAFRVASRELDAPARRARYRQSFDEQLAVQARLVAALDRLGLPEGVAAPLDAAVERVAGIIADGAAQAGQLPDAAYEVRGIRDGSLVTGTEKSKAVVFAALSALSGDPDSGVPRGCGRRGALDLSPAVTFPS